MKRIFEIKLMLLLFAGLVIQTGAQAATYTTINHGSWSSSSTWAGGNIPGSNLNGHTVNINHVVLYNLVNNIRVNSGTINIDRGKLTVPNQDVTLTNPSGEINITDGLLVMDNSNLSNNNGTITLCNSTIILDNGNFTVGNNGAVNGTGYVHITNDNLSNSGTFSPDIAWCLNNGNGSGLPTSENCLTGLNTGHGNGAVKFRASVSADTVVEGGTITFTFEIVNLTSGSLSNVSFDNTLADGLLWDSEPHSLSSGIALGATSITGIAAASFTITTLPRGTSSFQIDGLVPNPYLGVTPSVNNGLLGSLPSALQGPLSAVAANNCSLNPVELVVLDDGDCIGNFNDPVISANFTWNHKTSTVTSDRPLINVVLNFSDGTVQMIDGLSGYSGIFSGTGIHDDKCIIGIWVRTACNASGDGPEYGEYIANPIWDGMCGPPVFIDLDSQDHVSTVVLGNGPPIITPGDLQIDLPERGNHGNPGNSGDNGNDDNSGNDDQPGHNSTGIGVGPPSFDPRGNKANDFFEVEVNVWPNPVRSSQDLWVEGLSTDNEWTVHIYSVNGRQIASKPLYQTNRIDIADINLSPGIYILEMENGIVSTSRKVVVQ